MTRDEVLNTPLTYNLEVSKRNVLRQAIMDLAVHGYEDDLRDCVQYTFMRGYSVERLALFAMRRFSYTHDQAVLCVCELLLDQCANLHLIH